MRRARPLTGLVASLLALAVAGVWLDGHHRTFDLTANDSLTLTGQTRDVLQGVHQRVQVVALVSRQEAGRPEASALLERYHRLNHRVAVKVLDPADAPSTLKRLQMDPSVDVVAASIGSRVARGPTITEQDITSVIAQVSRNVSATLCVAAGHGETDPASEDDGGMAAAVRLLGQNGYKVKPLDLLSNRGVPGDCAGLIVANPTAALGPAGDDIAGYLAANGRVLFLCDPESTIDISPLLAPYRLALRRGIATDPDADAHLPDDPETLIVRSYHSSNPMVRRLPPTLFPAAEAIAVGDLTGAEGLAAGPVIQAGGKSFLERHPDHPGFTAGEDIPGPVTLVAAGDLSAVTGPSSIRRSRVVVFADVDFVTNRFIATGGNARLLVQAVDWATQDEDLVPLNTNIPPFRPLDLTTARTRYALVLSAGVVPALFLMAGAWVWAFRRRR